MLYSGTLTSLYKSLPPEAVHILEDAIRKSRLRLYDAAEHVFDNELSLYSHLPVVAFEHAETLLHRYKCFRILDVLAKIHTEQTSNDGDQNDMQRLTSLFMGVVKMLTEGNHEPVLEQIHRLRRDWALKPVDEYSDIQVRASCWRLRVSANRSFRSNASENTVLLA
jgi:hypothetical protein